MINLFSFAKLLMSYGSDSIEINRMPGQCQLTDTLCANQKLWSCASGEVLRVRANPPPGDIQALSGSELSPYTVITFSFDDLNGSDIFARHVTLRLGVALRRAFDGVEIADRDFASR
jgi:hypothetical protein